MAKKIARKQKDVDDTRVRSWCSLPDELLSLILSYLLGGDIAVFRSVCKCWNTTTTPITTKLMILPHPPSNTDDVDNDESPLLLLANNKLLHPLLYLNLYHHMQVYDDESSSSRAILHASNCGWLLMALNRRYIFFINPFTKERIQLPGLKVDDTKILFWPKLTFSSPPTSPDCLVFGVAHSDGTMDNLCVYTTKPGLLKWDIHTFYSKGKFTWCSCSPVLFKGLYYCLDYEGGLLIYDVKRKEAQLIGPPNPPLIENRFTLLLGTQYYMVESQGELLMVLTHREGDLVNVMRMDLTKEDEYGIWEKLHTLGETMLFLSNVKSFSAKSIVRGTGNKIYFPKFDGDNQLFYSLATRKYHYFAGGSSFSNFDGTRSYPNGTWIKPLSFKTRQLCRDFSFPRKC